MSAVKSSMQISADQAVFLFQTVLPTLENEHRLTIKVLQAIPAGQADYRPDPHAKSAFDLAWHMATAETRFLAAVATGQFSFDPFSKPKELSEVIAFHIDNFSKNVAAIKQLSGEKLAKMIDFREKFQWPAVSFITFNINHIVHHRGQLSVYLRPMGGKVPAIYGESYDSEQAKLAAAG
jgi:uncharacterized damage-inducible protein DinB